MIKIKCTNCNYQKEVLENEVMENTECEICGGKMLFLESADYLAEQKEADEGNLNESAGMNEIMDNQLMACMILEIENYGKEKAWENINNHELSLRLDLIPVYIEAVRRLKEDI
jgi:hypothetical protein